MNDNNINDNFNYNNIPINNINDVQHVYHHHSIDTNNNIIRDSNATPSKKLIFN